MIAKGAQGAKRRVLDPCQVWGFFFRTTRICFLTCYNRVRALVRSSHMRLTAAEQRAKLAKLSAIEGYDSIEELASAILSELRLPRHLHE